MPPPVKLENVNNYLFYEFNELWENVLDMGSHILSKENGKVFQPVAHTVKKDPTIMSVWCVSHFPLNWSLKFSQSLGLGNSRMSSLLIVSFGKR